MSLFKQTLFKIQRINFVTIARYSVIPTSDQDLFNFKSNFTEEEQIKILNIINEPNSQLSRFKVSQFRIKNIETWKNKKGPFRSLGEILEVEGLGEKLLQKLCEDIVNEKTTDLSSVNISNGKIGRFKHLVTPVIGGNIINNLSSGVGVHLSPTGISWAKLNREENRLVNWNFEVFTSLPKKMSLDETFAQSIDIIKKIPPGDVYIFETNPSLSPQSQTQFSAVSAYTQQLELNAMLLTLLNTSVTHNATLQNPKDDASQKQIENRVFYLKSRIPARLFNTLVGQEKVSAITIIEELLKNGDGPGSSLPTTPVTVEQRLKISFNSQPPAKKELLGQALMLIISFMDLCVYKNPVSIAAMNITRKKK